MAENLNLPGEVPMAVVEDNNGDNNAEDNESSSSEESLDDYHVMWVFSDESVADSNVDNVGVPAPVGGARDALTVNWFHENFGWGNSLLEYRRFRAFIHGYDEEAYRDGIFNGGLIQKRLEDGFKNNLDAHDLVFFESFLHRQEAGLTLKVGEKELVKHVRRLVFFRHRENVDPNDIVMSVGIGGSLAVHRNQNEVLEFFPEPDEFSDEWYIREFGDFGDQVKEERRLHAAHAAGRNAAFYAGYIRGRDIANRMYRKQTLIGADFDYLKKFWQHYYKFYDPKQTLGKQG